MSWNPGDVAVIDSFESRRTGEFCILRRRYEDEYGSNDYFYNERGKRRVIPNAWIVECVNRPHIDCCLVSENVLGRTDNPNEKAEWMDCPWQPIEYIKFP